MNNEMYTGGIDMAGRFRGWERRHPYLFSTMLSFLLVSLALFYAPPLEVTEEDLTPADNIVFLDIENLQNQTSRRVAASEVSTTAGEVSRNAGEVERAHGVSSDPDAVDLSYQPNVVPPRPIGRLMKTYPPIAREKGIEAVINVELLIASNGRVKSVRVLGIRLSKTLHPDAHTDVAKAFARDAIKILQEARFSPPVVGGRNVPVKFEMPLRFRLED